MSLLTAAETLPFGIALGLIVGIALVEGFGMLLSLSPSNLLDQLVPEFEGDTGLDRMLGWLHLGKVPALVLLIVFLGGFAVFGYLQQMIVHKFFAIYLPAWLAGLLAVPPGLATVRALGAMIAHIVPRDETSAVSERTLIGRAGVVTAGTARRGLAAQARVRDEHGRTHHLLVEPDIDGEVFGEGVQVLIVSKAGAVYRCIANPYPTLL